MGPVSEPFPGPLSRSLLDELGRYVVAEPYPFVVDVALGHGMWLVTVDGREIFDWAGYYGSKWIAHNHPRLSEPDYVRRLVAAANNKICNPDLLTSDCVAYYRALHEVAPECMRNPKLEVYAVNSGAEAVENMMKYLINLHHLKMTTLGREPKGRRFIYFDQAFHGRTVFALNVTRISHDPVVTKDFHGFIPGNIQVPFPAVDRALSHSENLERTRLSLEIVEDFLRRFPDEIVGIVVEPLQGAGGHRVALPEFFQGLSELAHRFDVGLGFDEVQTAGGTTGKMFAVDMFDLPYPPQAIAVAKKFANGVVYMLHPMDDHGVLDSTWGGSLADMVRFVQELKIVREEKLIEQVPAKAARLVAALEELGRRHDGAIHNVRGLGLYQGFTLAKAEWKGRLVDLALQTENLLLLGAGRDSVRLRPNLNVTEGDIDLLISKLNRVLMAVCLRE